MRRFHVVCGLAALAAFLLSGAYMRFVVEPWRLPDGPHRLYVSRHIYVLAAALVHLALGAYVVPLATRGARAAQWTGSALLAASALLLIAAFAREPMHEPGAFGRYGLYTLLAGVVLHGLSAWRSARGRP